MLKRTKTKPIRAVDLHEAPETLAALRRGDSAFRAAFLLHVADKFSNISVWVRAVCQDGTECTGLLSRELADIIARALGERCRWLSRTIPVGARRFRTYKDEDREPAVH